MKFLLAFSFAIPVIAQTMNEFTQGGCKGTVMIYARGSAEGGNVGFIVGPPLFGPLKRLVPDTAVEGVPYAASLLTNLGMGGADPKGVEAATSLFNSVHTKCPKSAIVAGGYSQGAAVMHRSIEKLSKAVQDHIAGVTLFGDTQNKQDKGKINKFPKEKVKVFCNKDDGVCDGHLNVNAGHMSYTSDMNAAAEFLAERIKIWKSSHGS